MRIPTAADSRVLPVVVRQGIACQCAGVTHAELDEAIACDPDADVASLGAALGCGLQCGTCIPVIREALGEIAWFPATAQPVAITGARDVEGLQRLVYRVEITLQGNGSYPAVLPGQHVVLRARAGGELVERTYTVVAQDRPGRKLTVAIRRKPGGRMTPWLLEPTDDGTPRTLEVSVPGGRALGSGGKRPDVFFAAGVGVTPAVAMVNALPPNAKLHLHYSVSSREDAAFVPEFDARAGACPGFSYSLRDTSVEGRLPRRSVRNRVARWPEAMFHICGPEAYVEAVRRTLLACKVTPERIHVELFALGNAPRAGRPSRTRSYLAGAVLGALPAFLLLPDLQELRPHGHPNVGHEQLQCVACHAEAPGSTRQALQAKVKHALGMRETGAVLGMQPVTSATCIQCHANPDDRHAPHRFLEPRFDQARTETGAQLCVSCHREHAGVRVTAPSTGYCVSCHQDLQVKEDRTSPTHDQLVRQKRWDTCLQCHDYHGNHKWSAPLRLQDAPQLEALEKYLQAGPSPYGGTVVKARQEPTR